MASSKFLPHTLGAGGEAMLGQICPAVRGRSRVRREELYGLPVLRVCVCPAGWFGRRRVRQALRALRRRGAEEVLFPPGMIAADLLEESGLRPVSPEPLLRAAAAPLALALLEREHIAPETAAVALRSRRAGPEVCRAAETLCPRVRGLILDAPRGGAELAEHLRRRFGIPILPRETAGAVGVCFSSACSGPDRHSLHLCPAGVEAAGLRVSLPTLDRENQDNLPLLAALWQAGRLPLSALKIT